MITEGMRDPDDSDDSEGEYHENGSEEEVNELIVYLYNKIGTSLPRTGHGCHRGR